VGSQKYGYRASVNVPALIVIAPHPDDDVLGCGGAIAGAAARGVAVHVVYVTDGAASHRGSQTYPPARLRALREREARCAAARLARDVRATFLRWPDGSVPHADRPEAQPLIAQLVAAFAPGALVLAPWRRDPHPDHRATASLAQAAVVRHGDVQLAEYFVWLDERGAAADRPAAGEGTPFELEITPFVAAKRAALAEHRTQLGLVIDDADEAFVLPPGVVARAGERIERYVLW
jgi:LmbE family N-acetylglucosaminyl deacetylase